MAEPVETRSTDDLVDGGSGDVADEGVALRTIVHDLRQPALAIAVIATLLAEHDGLPEDVVEYVRQLNAQARWMSDLLGRADGDAGTDPDAVTTPPRTAAARGPAHLDRTDISALARETVGSARATYPGVLVVETPGPTWVRADHTSLRRAVSNLLTNAVRAAGPEGRICVTVSRDAGGSSIAVDDDGPGFGRVQLGNRLGLTVVVQAAVSAGGTVEIGRSELGGARVALSLPSGVTLRSGC